MNELDELIRQKKELEKRIKELKNQASVVGKTKIIEDLQELYNRNKE